MTLLYFIVGLAAALMLGTAIAIGTFASFGGGLTSSQTFTVVLLLAGGVMFGLVAWWALRKSDKWPN